MILQKVACKATYFSSTALSYFDWWGRHRVIGLIERFNGFTLDGTSYRHELAIVHNPTEHGYKRRGASLRSHANR